MSGYGLPENHSMQELLRHYGESGRTEEEERSASPSRGNTLFALLPADVQALVQPFLDSRFTVTGFATPNMDLVFTSAGIPFSRWLCNWLRQLIDNFASGVLQPVMKP